MTIPEADPASAVFVEVRATVLAAVAVSTYSRLTALKENLCKREKMLIVACEACPLQHSTP